MSYDSFLSKPLKEYLWKDAQTLFGIKGLQHVGQSGGLETKESLEFLVQIYRELKPKLDHVLKQRHDDRKFIDERTRALAAFNSEFGVEVSDDDYKTVLGLEDKDGRIVVGPHTPDYWKHTTQKPVAPIPPYLQGSHVTLFGPPDSAKMCINAMNAYHRELKGEPAIVKELLADFKDLPKWGADDEDSKTPMREDLVSAGENLSRCFTKDLSLREGEKTYELKTENLSLPIKRFPGLAMPCPFLFLDGEALPLHLYDFALHFFKNWNRPEALVFYVPKLENEEEARYVHGMIESAEKLIRQSHPDYKMGTVRLMIVLENPRAVFRTNEIMDELYPYFAGASLGWHDYLASAARLFREDGNYRIPLKADPDIVIKYIKASHDLLAQVVGPRGGIKVGGMYGILPIDNDLKSDSFQLTLKGYFRDVFTQMKRDLTGFWVAHPDFVRLGLAMVAAWKVHQKGDSSKIKALVTSLMAPKYQDEVLNFIFGTDVPSLDPASPRYARALIVSDLKQSNVVANNDLEEVRYNVFQSLQYLTDWLSGNGCVALPGQIGGVSVRIMDDLATAERSRWEVWHEIRHGRLKLEDFLKIAFEELHFIQKDLSNPKKIVQVKWTEQNSKWYPIALKLMIKLMTDPEPAEFATELLLPFTMSAIRDTVDPWKLVNEIDPQKYALRSEAERFMHFFECCGHKEWASEMSSSIFCDIEAAKALIMKFSKQDIIEAASFHGNIGENKQTLDASAAGEQAKVLGEAETVRQELLTLGNEYFKKFGIKFLISARDKSAAEILSQLKARSKNTLLQELQNARLALCEITENRLLKTREFKLRAQIEELKERHKIEGCSLAVSLPDHHFSTLALGHNRAEKSVTPETRFQLASLSKSIASAFAIEFFQKENIPLSTRVNDLLQEVDSKFRLRSAPGCPESWADEVTLEHLMRHEALNLHYVNGAAGDRKLPDIEELLGGSKEIGLDAVAVISKPGSEFHYSGGGFIVLEYLIEAVSRESIVDLTRPFLTKLGLFDISFDQYDQPDVEVADAVTADGELVAGGRKHFPAFAAGALGTPRAMQEFLTNLSDAFEVLHPRQSISHDTGVQMLSSVEKGSLEFMKARMGLGIFVLEAGNNKIALHQGANDGFRCLFLHCFAGPDRGKGFTILSNGELNAVQFIADVAKLLLKNLNFSGIDFEKFSDSFQTISLKQEEIVNRGYKELIFSAFQETRPEPIPRRKTMDPLAAYNLVIGSKILSCTNQKFALAENLLSPYLPVFEVDLYGQQGKVMDSWESARHSVRESEDLVFELKTPSNIEFVMISTQFHLGNQVPFVSLDAQLPGSNEFFEILPKTAIDGHAFKKIKLVKPSGPVSRVKVRTYPDGGLTRLGLFGESLPDSIRKDFAPLESAKSQSFADEIPQPKKPLSIPFAADAREQKQYWRRIEGKRRINFASSALGASIVSVSNQHYSPASQVISPMLPLNMFDGFESARSRKPGHFEECVIRLARPARIQEIELDFSYFVNNNPRAIAIEFLKNDKWKSLVARTDVKAFAGNKKTFAVDENSLISELRFLVYPDGGINRIRVY